MFGGKLCTSNIIFLNKQNTFLASFGSIIYKFNKQAQIIDRIIQHQYPIINFCEINGQLVSIDQNGNIFISQNGNKKKQLTLKHKIEKALFFGNEIYYILNQQIQVYNLTSKKSKLVQQLNEINLFTISNNYLLFSEKLTLFVYDLNQKKLIKQILHNKHITSVIIRENDIVIGDVYGKIKTYIDALILQNIQNTTQEHWHIHKVNQIISQQRFLFSCGQQGVVVFWHLGINKKDFLPRFGCQIVNMILDQEQNQLACFLSDNSIRIIQLNNDKNTILLKIIMNPHGIITKKTKDQPQNIKFHLGIHFNSQKKIICTNSIPGKLQFIDLSGRQTYTDLQVIRRNHISRLDDCYPNPNQIAHIQFNEDWTILAVITTSIYIWSIKFYKFTQQWELVSKVDNPHDKQTSFIRGFHTFKENCDKFVTGGHDNKIKIWKEYSRKKKSLIHQNEYEYFWNCEHEFNYKNKQALAIDHYYNSEDNCFLINYGTVILFLNVSKGQIIKELNLQIQNINELTYSKNNILFSNKKQFVVYDILSNIQKFVLNSLIISYCYNTNQQKVAILHLQNNQAYIVTVVDLNQSKILNCFKIKPKIQNIFWAQNNLFAVSNQLDFIQLIVANNLFAIQKNNQIQETAQEQAQVQIALNESFNLSYQKIVHREIHSQKFNNKINQISNQIEHYPSFVDAFKILSKRLLI